MMKKLILAIGSVIFCVLCGPVHSQTIAEKKESFYRNDGEMDPNTLEQLREVNLLLDDKRREMAQLFDQAQCLYESDSGLTFYEPLLDKIRVIKGEIVEIQRMWKAEASSLVQNEEYALWHQPDTTLQQLIMDYGAPDNLYLVPPEIGGIRMSLNSNLPIPRESWGECLELILAQYGIGIRQLNPYLKELFILRNDPSGIKGILDAPEQLDFYPPQARICYMLIPYVTDPRSDLMFLQRFSNPASTKLEIIDGKIFITASVDTVQELLKLYTFASSGGKRQEFQLITLSKINAREMEAILNSAFHSFAPSNCGGEEGSTLKVIPLEQLSQSLFLSGSSEEIKKAMTLVKDVEAQIEDPQEKTVFWYTVKHSDPEELATVLARVYDLLIGQNSNATKKKSAEVAAGVTGEKLIVPAIQVGPKGEKRTSHKTADGQNNFIVDPKTSSIIMVVEAEALPKIKELLKKLDVPKKMVQIEVLLFEKKVSNSNNIGLNLLRLGSEAKNIIATGLSWGTGGAGAGILEFLISRNKGSGIPAYDLAYQFMLGQQDVQINASPSVTTMNQTPAKIAIVDEMSIDSGSDKDKNRIYTRAQYGITIEITPTINMDETCENQEENFVTLETDITFDVPKKTQNERPEVARRHIKNHVRIADGQTLILGGLRRKSSQDSKDSIPFLGEIPGLGKLFSHSTMSEDSTEMFVFITPKIISDPIKDAERIKRDELKKRPGDIPEFLHELALAKEGEKRRFFQGSLTALFGRQEDRVQRPQKGGEEYDGR